MKILQILPILVVAFFVSTNGTVFCVAQWFNTLFGEFLAMCWVQFSLKISYFLKGLRCRKFQSARASIGGFGEVKYIKQQNLCVYWTHPWWGSPKKQGSYRLSHKPRFCSKWSISRYSARCSPKSVSIWNAQSDSVRPKITYMDQRLKIFLKISKGPKIIDQRSKTTDQKTS